MQGTAVLMPGMPADGIRGCYARMLIARAITSPAMTRDTAASVIISASPTA